MVRIYVWLCAVFVSIGGCLWGYDTGSINGVKEMHGFRNAFDITFTQRDEDNQTDSAQCASTDDVETSALMGAIVSIFSIGALVGALLSGLLSDLAGRKVTVIVGATSCAIGATLQTSSIYLWMFFPGRVISGVGAGILLQACPLYIAEIAPKERRGTMVAMVISFSITAVVVGVIINAIIEGYPFGWRISISIQIIVGIILMCGAIFLPETPRFLLKKHKDAKALAVLKKIYKEQRKAEDEVINIQLSLRHSRSMKDCIQTLRNCCNGSIIQRVLIGFTLMLISRAVGGPIIIYYSVSIFCKLGVDGFLGTIVMFILMFFGQIAGVLLVDKCGRKSLLLLGSVVLGLSLMIAAALIQIFNLEDNPGLSEGSKVAGYFVIALICISMTNYNMTYASVGWVVLSEIYPLRIRGVGTALGQVGWWGGTFLMSEIGPILFSSPLRTYGTFYLLSGICVLSYLYVLFLVPETKGQSLEDIELLFTESWFKRTDILYYLRCGCFCCLSQRRRRMLQVQISETADSAEEREQLHEPLDQISLTSADLDIEPDDGWRTKEFGSILDSTL